MRGPMGVAQTMWCLADSSLHMYMLVYILPQLLRPGHTTAYAEVYFRRVTTLCAQMEPQRCKWRAKRVDSHRRTNFNWCGNAHSDGVRACCNV